MIALDLNDPDAAEVLYPAKYRDYLDWDTMNKLAMNSDFKEFLTRIKKDIAGKEFRTEWYDRVLECEALLKTLPR